MIDLLLLGALCATSAALGLALLRAVAALPSAPRDHLLAGLMVGLGLTSMASLGLAAGGMLRPWPFVGLGVLAAVVGGRDLVRALRAVHRSHDAVTWTLVVLCGVVLLAELPASIAPPVGGDQTKYQLAYPRLYGMAGGLVPTPWTFWGQQQFLQNFLFAAGFALSGDTLARLLNLVSGVLAALSIATLARRHLGRRTGGIAAALFFTLPMCWSLMLRAGSDLAVVAYAALGMCAVLDWAGGQRPGDLRRAALLAGLAGGTKVMGLLVPALLAVVVLVVMIQRAWPIGRVLVNGLAVGLLVLAMACPWYVRNAVETGNPLYPFGQSIFPGKNWSTAAGAYLDDYYEQYRTTFATRREGEPYAGLAVLRFPWDLTMYPESFENSPRQAYDVSPLALAFVPGVLLLRRRRSASIIVAAVGLAYTAIIAGGAWAHPRYVLPGVALMMAAAVPAAQLVCGRRLAAALFTLTIASNLALSAVLLRPMWADQVRVSVGRMSPDEFLRKYSDRYRFWEKANAAIPPDGRVAVLEKIPHPYYIERPFILLSYLEQGLVDYRQVDTVDALAHALADRQVTFVAVDTAGLEAAGDPFEASVARLWRGLVATQGQLVLRQGGYALYALRPVTAVALGPRP